MSKNRKLQSQRKVRFSQLLKLCREEFKTLVDLNADMDCCSFETVRFDMSILLKAGFVKTELSTEKGQRGFPARKYKATKFYLTEDDYNTLRLISEEITHKKEAGRKAKQIYKPIVAKQTVKRTEPEEYQLHSMKTINGIPVRVTRFVADNFAKKINDTMDFDRKMKKQSKNFVSGSTLSAI